MDCWLPPEAKKRQERSPPRVPGSMTLSTLFRLPASRTGRKYISVVLSPPVCGICYDALGPNAAMLWSSDFTLVCYAMDL